MSVLKIKDGSGNWVVVPALNGTNAVGDVMINGTSMISNGVAQIPIANSSTFGVAKVAGAAGIGIGIDGAGRLYIVRATSGEVKGGVQQYAPITPAMMDQAAFYGLTKAAGVDMSASNNAVGTYTSEAKTAIQTMLGIPDAITAAVPTNNNQLTNGAGYQTASDVQTAITTALSAITQFRFEVVNALPNSGENGVVYLLSHGGSETNNDYDEYIWVTNNNESGFEKLGTLALDLSGYLQTNDTITSAQIQALFA